MYRVWNYLSEYSLLLVLGALLALGWANIDYDSYHDLVEYTLWENAPIGDLEDGSRTMTLHYLINDVLMAMFFAIAGKEVWEAVVLKDGSLRGKKALTPLIATSGGILGPIAIYFGLALLMGGDTLATTSNGWAVPIATDIAFAYLIGRLIFGAGHPAVGFLLLLAIADDAIGLIILAVFYPTGELALEWLLLSLAAAGTVFFVCNSIPRRMDRGKQDRPNSTWMREKLGVWPYVIAGCLSWYGFMRAGIHPALGLLPVIPAIPHADRAFGIFADAERHLTDLLNTLEHAMKGPVEIVLFLFGLANAGVLFNAVGDATWLVLAGLLVGKPLGIFAMGWLAAKPLKLGLPEGMRLSDIFVLGCVAAIGFTVSLFIAAVAFDSGQVQDAAKMGALLSFAAAIMAFAAAAVFKTQKITGGDS